MTDRYPEVRDYLLREHAAGRLGLVAAYSKLSEGMLRDIAIESEVLTDDVAAAVRKVMT